MAPTNANLNNFGFTNLHLIQFSDSEIEKSTIQAMPSKYLSIK
jgi:hypothetical protein